MFRGNHPARVDEKGRLKLPADFKSLLGGEPEAKQEFYITSKDGKRAEIWPIQAWEKVEEELANPAISGAARRAFLDVTNYYGQMAEMDGQGRILLPQILRDKAELTGDVVVLGTQKHLEVVNRATFEAVPPAVSAEVLAALDSLGI